VPSGGLLGVDELPVDGDLEDASTGGDEHEVVDRMLELFEDLGRQTDGLIEIASNGAVLDADLHRTSRRRIQQRYHGV
jgi:hypothetical protein